MDWSATQQDASNYEVQLTLSGGKEADGSPRVPLRFAFKVDLEQRTVMPGGTGGTQTNTLRAFFDESRIPPKNGARWPKTPEELVLAAQPDASPLALDTMTRHFIATYSAAAAERVASATTNLSNVEKKLRHTPTLENEALLGRDAWRKKLEVIAPKPKEKPIPSMSGTIEYTMQKLDGRRTAVDCHRTVHGLSFETLGKCWTGYDRPGAVCSRFVGQ